MDKKRITIAFLIVLTNTIGATAILPMLPLYVENQFRATPLQATLVIAAFYAAQIVAAPWLGKLSDRALAVSGKIRHPFVPPPSFGGEPRFFVDAQGLERFNISP